MVVSFIKIYGKSMQTEPVNIQVWVNGLSPMLLH